jgi:hypothetical protein
MQSTHVRAVRLPSVDGMLPDSGLRCRCKYLRQHSIAPQLMMRNAPALKQDNDITGSHVRRPSVEAPHLSAYKSLTSVSCARLLPHSLQRRQIAQRRRDVAHQLVARERQGSTVTEAWRQIRTRVSLRHCANATPMPSTSVTHSTPLTEEPLGWQALTGSFQSVGC